MSSVLVDSNVLIDLATDDPQWSAWSARMVAQVGSAAALVINPVVFAEVSVFYDSIAELDEVFPPLVFRREPIPYAAAFLAGKAFVQYRRRGGPRTSPLPDFFIGAHAAIAGYRLLTRDPQRYRAYFPTVKIIAPN
jgi:predicted nucleic acid-binding protein